MSKPEVLLLANSVYHLFTALHMRRTILRENKADLLLTDVTPHLRDYLPRLEKSGLFRSVLFAQTKELAAQYHANRPEKVTEAFEKQERLLRWALSDALPSYDAVYFANFDLFARLLASHYAKDHCRFYGYEDGFSSYVIDYLRPERAAINRHPQGQAIGESLAGIYLYEPRLAMRGDQCPNLALPKINPRDVDFRRQLNHIFDYHSPGPLPDFIFLEQSFRAEGIQTNDLALMAACRQAVGGSNFIVKPHPRNTDQLPFRLGLTRKYPGSVPWELFLMNEDLREKTILTVCSNGALTSRLLFGMELNTVMLYGLFSGKVLWQEDAVLKRYLRAFRSQFAGAHYYVPQTEYQLQKTLTFLGGRYGTGD